MDIRLLFKQLGSIRAVVRKILPDGYRELVQVLLHLQGEWVNMIFSRRMIDTNGNNNSPPDADAAFASLELGRLEKVRTLTSAITTAWGVDWDEEYIVRDLMQNFFNCNRDRLNDVRVNVAGANVSVTAPASFSLERLYYLVMFIPLRKLNSSWLCERRRIIPESALTVPRSDPPT